MFASVSDTGADDCGPLLLAWSWLRDCGRSLVEGSATAGTSGSGSNAAPAVTPLSSLGCIAAQFAAVEPDVPGVGVQALATALAAAIARLRALRSSNVLT